MHGDNGTKAPANGEMWPPRRLQYPIDETAALLGGITEREVYNRIDAGDLERVKLGRRAFVTAGSIEAYVEKLRAEAAARRDPALT